MPAAPSTSTRNHDLPSLSGEQETAWIEVIEKMEEVYSDLIRYEVNLEEKNKALEEAQRFIGSVLASMSDILVVCDAKGRIQQVNKAFLDLTGLGEHALSGRPVRSLFVEDESSRRFSERLSEGGLQDCEVRMRTPDGPTEPVAMNCSIRYDQRGRPAGMVLMGRPVGELRRAYEALNTAHAELQQAQQQLIQAEKMASLGRLVAGVAHELNNPISFIYGNVHTLNRYRERLAAYLEALHNGAETSRISALRRDLRIDHLLADLQPLIDGTLEGAERLADTVKNLRRLSFSRTGEAETFNLSDTIRTAVQWATKGMRHPIAMKISLPETMTVRGHSGQMHQVVVNLVQNAMDALTTASSQPREVEISASREGGTGYRVAVMDNGPGIADENLLLVFDPFFTTKPVGQGTGLGLWVSYGIIKDHGGTIEATNRPQGGACFAFTVPAA